MVHCVVMNATFYSKNPLFTVWKSKVTAIPHLIKHWPTPTTEGQLIPFSKEQFQQVNSPTFHWPSLVLWVFQTSDHPSDNCNKICIIYHDIRYSTFMYPVSTIQFYYTAVF